MKYKAVISDLDGTLLNSKHTVSDYTKEVVRNLSEKGIKFFIATGRHYLDIVHLREKMNLDTFFITSNGARVHDSEGRVILKHNIDKKTAAEILSLELDESIFVNIYKDDKWFISKENEMLKDFHSESDFFYNLTDFSNIGDCEPMKIFYLCEEEELLISLHKRLEENFGDRVNITFSTPNCLEIMKKGVSKGVAITEIMGIEGISLEAAIAFGDGLNDYEMLKVSWKRAHNGKCPHKVKRSFAGK